MKIQYHLNENIGKCLKILVSLEAIFKMRLKNNQYTFSSLEMHQNPAKFYNGLQNPATL